MSDDNIKDNTKANNNANNNAVETKRLLKVSYGTSRKHTHVVSDYATSHDIYKKAGQKVETPESQDEFMAMGKKHQDEIKDKGYIFGGGYKDDIRKGVNVECRDLLILDMDDAPKNYRKVIAKALKGIEYCVYSTHKHHPEKHRLRIMLPFSRTLPPEEYEPVARKTAQEIGMKYFDDTTYEVGRMMYTSTTSKDAEHIFYVEYGDWLDVDKMLSKYDDWKDVASWPVGPGQAKKAQKARRQAGNPALKPGLIGAFCRAFRITDTISEFLADIYSASDLSDRYTYIQGTTANGAVVYDNMFLYSHHNTDPAGGQLNNAFDLVRIHHFIHFDKDVDDDTPIYKRPSHDAMIEFCRISEKVKDDEGQSLEEFTKEFLTRYVFVVNGNGVADMKSPAHLCVSEIDEFNNSTANQWIDVDAGTNANPTKTKRLQMSKVWLAHQKRKTAIDLSYHPGKNRTFRGESDGLFWVNEYTSAKFDRTDKTDGLKVFFEHMDFILPIEAEREWFINWMAFNLQKPEERCQIVPLHVSVIFGTGRGWLVKLMDKLLGEWNCSRTKMAELSGEGSQGAYNSYLHKTLFCAIEEVKESIKRYSVSDKIRDVLIADRLPINIKFGENGTKDIFTNFFLMSNHNDAMVIPKDDRRLNILTGPDRFESGLYYTQLYNWLKTEGVGQLYWWLKNKDLSDFKTDRPMDTPALQSMTDSNQTETESLFWEMMENPPHKIMGIDQIIKHLQNLSGKESDFSLQGGSDIDDRQLKKLLAQYALKPFGRKQFRIGDKHLRPWQFVRDEKIMEDEAKQILLSQEAA